MLSQGFRLGWVTLVALALIAAIAILAPQQLPVFVWKFAILAFAAVAGYWLDRHLFPYARPHQYADVRSWNYSAISFAAVMLRRALVVGACIIAASNAL